MISCYKCEHCGKVFNDSDEAYAHENSHFIQKNWISDEDEKVIRRDTEYVPELWAPSAVVSGYHVYVEDGFIIRGIVDKGTSHERPAYVYRWVPGFKLWNRSIIITVNAFRSGVRRGTIMMM